MFRWHTRKHFAVANEYSKQFLYSFLRTKNIYFTLEDLEFVFNGRKMGECVKKAKAYLLSSANGKRAEEKALSLIEEVYGDELMCLMHKVCIRAENIPYDLSSFLASSSC